MVAPKDPLRSKAHEWPKTPRSLILATFKSCGPGSVTNQVAWVLYVSPPSHQDTWQVPLPPCARGYPTPQLRPPPPPAPRVRPPPRRAHLLSRLQVPLQRLLRELPDAQLALLARHHDAGPAEAYGHFHPGPWRSRQAWPNRCLAPRVQPPLSGDSQHWRARKPGAPLPSTPSGPGARCSASSPRAGGLRGRESGRGRQQGEDLIYLPGGRGARTRRQGVRAPPPAPAPAPARARLRWLLRARQSETAGLALSWSWPWPWRRRDRPQAPGWSGRLLRRAGPELGGNFCAGPNSSAACRALGSRGPGPAWARLLKGPRRSPARPLTRRRRAGAVPGGNWSLGA